MSQVDSSITAPVRRSVVVSLHAQDTARPFVRSLAAGQVLCREGDPPGPAWVVISGSVRVYRRDLKTPNAVEQLTRLGPGAVVGEMATLLDKPRSATVQAVAPAEVLELPPRVLASLAQTHPGLLRVIVLALKERAGLTSQDLAQVAARHDIALGEVNGLLPDISRVDHRETSVPVYDPQIAYPKTVVCPACQLSFSALMLRPNKDQPMERESDFHQLYGTPWKPYDYELWTCPSCLYTAFPPDFGDLNREQAAQVPEAVADVIGTTFDGQRLDFSGERTLALREQALQLALALYTLRGSAPLRLASVYHRLAWCAREGGDELTDRRWLREALEAYKSGYREEELDGAKAEIRVQYLCGELSRRTGDAPAAVHWFSQVLRHAAIKQHPVWERMARDGWALVREVAA